MDPRAQRGPLCEDLRSLLVASGTAADHHTCV
jgi:hypothetical protein